MKHFFLFFAISLFAFSVGCQEAHEQEYAARSMRKHSGCTPPARMKSESCYMILGSMQGGVFSGKSHTFAVFCRCRGQEIVETKTISWMPQTLNHKIIEFSPQQGVNLTFKETVLFGTKNGVEVRLQAPKKIDAELYRRACEKVTELETGKTMFKSSNRFTRAKACNAVDALADLDKDRGKLMTSGTKGHNAAELLQIHFRKWIVEDDKDHSWLLAKVQDQLK